MRDIRMGYQEGHGATPLRAGLRTAGLGGSGPVRSSIRPGTPRTVAALTARVARAPSRGRALQPQMSVMWPVDAMVPSPGGTVGASSRGLAEATPLLTLLTKALALLVSAGGGDEASPET